MKKIVILALSLIVFLSANLTFAQEIKVCIDIRGNTGLEGRIKNIISREFSSIRNVMMTDDKLDCHLYIGLSVAEQQPIRFYGLGISIAYHIRGEFYSRPSTDVAQFGEERLEEICAYLVKEIDKAFLVPLKHPME